MAFDGKSSWSFGNNVARNVVIFATDNSSSAHSHRKNNFLILAEGPTSDFNGTFGSQEKKF